MKPRAVAYGADGCRCRLDEDWRDRHPVWLPMAHCPHHGVPALGEVDTYRVVRDGDGRAKELIPIPYQPGAMTDGCAVDSRGPRWTRWGEYEEPETAEPMKERGGSRIANAARSWVRRVLRHH